MSADMPFDAQRQRRAEAATDWLLRLREAPNDHSLLDQWLKWCAEDVDNLIEFRHACDLWNAFDDPALKALLSLPQTGLRRAAPVPRPRRRRARAWAAGMAAVLVAGVSAAVVGMQWNAVPRVVHRTAPAQHQVEQLVDGSRIELGAGSRVTHRFEPDLREVEVVRGEAYFDVAKDPERPFVVKAGKLRARAVGTAFNVRTGPSRTVVTVTDGLVEVTTERWFGIAQDNRRALAGPGEQVAYDDVLNALVLHQVDPEVVTAWRDGNLTFKFVNEPLADVVEYLNRYSTRRVEISDRTLGRRTFTGTVHHDRGNDWLLALEQAYPLRVVPQGDHTVRLVPKDSAVAGSR